jgi:hypothetical protein
MHIVPVQTEQQAQQFILVNTLINKNEPNYIQPLNKDVEAVFDDKKNKTFRKGKVERFLLFNSKHELIGRIAAFTNTAYKNKGDQLVYGGFGFFDCINDQTAANLLLNTAKQWLTEQGCEGMDGPINFGERDKFWGLLVDGFHSPLYGMNFNQPYYQALLENYGCKPFYNQLIFGRSVRTPIAEKMWTRHDELAKDPDYSSESISKKNLAKYAQDFATVYNKAWAGHGGLKQLELPVVKKMFASMKPIMDGRICFFAYYKKEPIAVYINLPDLNYYFKHFKGKLGWLQKIELLYRMRFKPTPTINGLVFGVVPAFQGKGIDSYIIRKAQIAFLESNYEYIEMQWIGDFNPKMVSIAKTLTDNVSRTYRVYRYHFDTNVPVLPHPKL